MVKAFAFGKFLPFHKGHQAMISFALTQCDFLSVLVCCDNEEHIPGEVRKTWIETTFKNTANIEVKILQYDNLVLPNTSQASLSVSEIWSAEFKKHYPDYSLLITSEPYGDLVAGFMGIKHIPFNLERDVYPVSATAIRNNLFSNGIICLMRLNPISRLRLLSLGRNLPEKPL